MEFYINTIKPDLVVMSGDMVSGDWYKRGKIDLEYYQKCWE